MLNFGGVVFWGALLNSHYISQRKGGVWTECGRWSFLLYNWVQLEDDQLRMFRSSSHLCFLSGLLLSRFWSLFNWIINDFAHISQDTLLKTNMTLENPWKSPCSIGNTSSNGGLFIVILVFGGYLKLPPHLNKEGNFFINCWWRVRGIFQGYVSEILEIMINLSYCNKSNEL